MAILVLWAQNNLVPGNLRSFFFGIVGSELVMNNNRTNSVKHPRKVMIVRNSIRSPNIKKKKKSATQYPNVLYRSSLCYSVFTAS